MYTVVRLLDTRILNSNQTSIYTFIAWFAQCNRFLCNCLIILLIWKTVIFALVLAIERWMYTPIFSNEWDSRKAILAKQSLLTRFKLPIYLHVLYSFHQNNWFSFTKSIYHKNINTEIQHFNFPIPLSKKKKKKNSFQSSLKLGAKKERKTITLYLVFQHESLLPDVWYPSRLSWQRYDLIVTGLLSDKAVRLREW